MAQAIVLRMREGCDQASVRVIDRDLMVFQDSSDGAIQCVSSLARCSPRDYFGGTRLRQEILILQDRKGRREAVGESAPFQCLAIVPEVGAF
jgi:hypothetical protein